MELITIIKTKVAEYLGGVMPFSEFRLWFAPVFLDIEATQNEKAIHLAYAIESYFAEFSEGLISEQQLKHALAYTAANPILYSSFSPGTMSEGACETGSSSNYVLQGLSLGLPLVIGRSMEFA